ncbi:uncharacterized protein L203_104735 [Cryptococcus depauperatus CBS 7841]|uniref:Uncharacterized protein n=1 Tax=Cryptococcus depauperatus CBS 7841 TaxID=1295531 RepID=A0AAJ8JW21_9TREE
MNSEPNDSSQSPINLVKFITGPYNRSIESGPETGWQLFPQYQTDLEGLPRHDENFWHKAGDYDGKARFSKCGADVHFKKLYRQVGGDIKGLPKDSVADLQEILKDIIALEGAMKEPLKTEVVESACRRYKSLQDSQSVVADEKPTLQGLVASWMNTAAPLETYLDRTLTNLRLASEASEVVSASAGSAASSSNIGGRFKELWKTVSRRTEKVPEDGASEEMRADWWRDGVNGIWHIGGGVDV